MGKHNSLKIRKCGVDFSFINLKALTKPDQNKRYNAPHLDSMGNMHRPCIAT